MELKIQELRIGNYYIYDDNIDQFTFQTIKDMEFEDGYIGEPLPITKELLIKLGFKDNNLKMGGYNWLELQTYWVNAANLGSVYIRISIPKDVNDKWGMTLNSAEPLTSVIQYYDWIHEIQNLYFSLTGKELTFPIDEIRNLKINQILK